MEYIVFYVAMQYEFITIACTLSPGKISHWHLHISFWQGYNLLPMMTEQYHQR